MCRMTQEADAAADDRLWTLASRWAAAWPAIVCLPIAGWIAAPFALRSTGGGDAVLFEIFGACAVIAALAAAGTVLRKGTNPWALAPAACLLLVIGLYGSLLADYSTRTGDYQAYEDAARALGLGLDPYGATGGLYRYPPLLAQVLCGIKAAVAGAGGPRLSEEQAWAATFFLYQSAQLLLVVAGFCLAYRLARRLGVSATAAALSLAALFVLNNPLLRTLHFNQPNLWLLDAVLAALLLADRRAAVAGIAVAAAAHVKIYPAILVLSWLWSRHRAAAAWAAIGGVGILLVSTAYGTNWDVWKAFAAFSAEFPKGTAFRDNSFYSVAFNSVGVITTATGGSEATRRLWAAGVWLLLAAAAALWIGRRFAIRNRRLQAAPVSHAASFRRSVSDSADALAFALMVSPMTWEHHYLLAMPAAIVALASVPADRRGQLLLALVLTFGIPTFDLFPLSYHRLAGLLWLLVLIGPGTMIGRPATGADGGERPHPFLTSPKRARAVVSRPQPRFSTPERAAAEGLTCGGRRPGAGDTRRT